MRRLSFLVFLGILAFATQVNAGQLDSSDSHFSYRDAAGRPASVGMMRHYWWKPIVHPFAKIDPTIDPKLCRAATIAQERAHAHSSLRCWQYVKEALLAAGAVASYPKTAYASEAGDELVHSYGFRKLPVRDPYAAPLGAVLVYRGHVEIRTKDGFASDYRSKNACFYPLIAAYGKST